MSVAFKRLLPRAAAGNDALASPLSQMDRETMICTAALKLEELLEILRVDHRNDPNTRGTPDRVARMLVGELLGGRFSAPPSLTDFENRHRYTGLIVTGPIEVRSTCAHHLMPIRGEAIIGVLPCPEGKVLGLSKYDRVVEHFASRLQTQEELVQQIGDFLLESTAARGIAVRVSASHMCRTQRGVRAHSGRMVTTAFFGQFATDSGAKDEFGRECAALSGAAR